MYTPYKQTSKQASKQTNIQINKQTNSNIRNMSEKWNQSSDGKADFIDFWGVWWLYIAV